MKKNLGLPIYYRIDKFIHFDDFSCDTIHSIVLNEILSRKEEYQDRLSPEMIYAVVSPVISTQGENARTIKYKVQQVVEELLFEDVLNPPAESNNNNWKSNQLGEIKCQKE